MLEHCHEGTRRSGTGEWGNTTYIHEGRGANESGGTGYRWWEQYTGR